jgi:hypothetical protein
LYFSKTKFSASSFRFCSPPGLSRLAGSVAPCSPRSNQSPQLLGFSLSLSLSGDPVANPSSGQGTSIVGAAVLFFAFNNTISTKFTAVTRAASPAEIEAAARSLSATQFSRSCRILLARLGYACLRLALSMTPALSRTVIREGAPRETTQLIYAQPKMAATRAQQFQTRMTLWTRVVISVFLKTSPILFIYGRE